MGRSSWGWAVPFSRWVLDCVWVEKESWVQECVCLAPFRPRIWSDFTLAFLPWWTVTWSWGLFYHSNGNESTAPCKKDQGKSWLDPWSVWFNLFCFGLYSALFVLVFVDSFLLSLSYPFLLLHSFSFQLEAIEFRGWGWAWLTEGLPSIQKGGPDFVSQQPMNQEWWCPPVILVGQNIKSGSL